jgi:hypothetical protein
MARAAHLQKHLPGRRHAFSPLIGERALVHWRRAGAAGLPQARHDGDERHVEQRRARQRHVALRAARKRGGAGRRGRQWQPRARSGGGGGGEAARGGALACGHVFAAPAFLPAKFCRCWMYVLRHSLHMRCMQALSSVGIRITSLQNAHFIISSSAATGT